MSSFCCRKAGGQQLLNEVPAKPSVGERKKNVIFSFERRPGGGGVQLSASELFVLSGADQCIRFVG